MKQPTPLQALYALSATLTVLIGVATSASAQVVYSQNFESTAVGAKPAEVRAVFNFGGGSPAPNLTVQNDAIIGSRVLQATPTATFAVLTLRLPSSLTLGSTTGDSITTAFRFRTGGTPQPTALRFGLFNLNGSTYPAVDNSSAAFNGDFGYRTDVLLSDNGNINVGKEFGSVPNTVVTGVGPTTFGTRTDTDAATGGGGPDYTAFAASAGFGAGVNIGTNPYDLTFSLTRIANGGITLSTSISGAVVRTVTTTDNPGNDSAGTTVGSNSDNTGVFNTFDYIGISLGNQSQTLFLDNFQVSAATAVVPEAGTIYLAAIGLMGLGGAGVRNRRRR